MSQLKKKISWYKKNIKILPESTLLKAINSV